MKTIQNINKLMGKLTIVLIMLFAFFTTTYAQNYYVFKNGSNFLINNNGILSTSTTFAPNAVWQASNSLGNTNRTLSSYINSSQYLNGSASNNSNVSIGSSANNVWQYREDGLCTRRTGRGEGTYFLTQDGSSFKTKENVSSKFTNASVTINNTADQIFSSVTINVGTDLITTAGTYNYGHSTVTYQKGYVRFALGGTYYYFTDNSASATQITPTPATINYSWSLTPNSYATVNSSTGAVTVNSMPVNDVQITLTVTATATGGIPAADPNFILTGSKVITIQGSHPSAPGIFISGNTVTINNTAAGSTTIRYTIDGTDPTASSTLYSGPFELSNTSPVTIKAVTIRGGNLSPIATHVVTLTLPAPIITADAAAGTATIATSVAGATIHYTTDGTNPTTSSPTYNSTITGLTAMQEVRAIAVKSGWNNSPIASATLVQESGVTDGIVTLFDYEDHSWSYYSDEENPIHSWNPADVKITYLGNGLNTVSTNDDDIPTSFDAPANGVKVGIDANAHTFVYYKTLERTDGRTAASPAAATGRCPYTTIQNPFSVRPTYGSDNSRWRGFYKWRVKSLSGGTIYSAASGGTTYSVGQLIDAETEIYFAPDSEYGMQVEFEALWARAYLVTNATNNTTGLKQAVGVERNFNIITTSAPSNITSLNVPCTYTSIYPNGTTNGTTVATSVTIYKNGEFTANADSKIEYIQLRNSNSTINAAGKNFTIGRGVSGNGSGDCATNLYGLSANSTTSFRFNIASGKYQVLNFMGGNGTALTSGKQTAILGCDYDRAMNDNTKLIITSDNRVGYKAAAGKDDKGKEVFHCTVKSGNYVHGTLGDDAFFYLSMSNSNTITSYGKRTLIVEGGILADIAGGMDSSLDDFTGIEMVNIRIKGGTIKGAVYGAAQHSNAYGDRRFVITGGDFEGWIAGGANGTYYDEGKLEGAASIYVGGTANVNSNGSNTVMNRAIGGNVFGAGCGYSKTSNSGQVTQGTTVVIADEAYIERGVYGGGSFGYCSTDQTANIYILGGTVGGVNGGVNGTNYNESIVGGVFGGACQNNGGSANIYMKGGTVKGGLYGGSNDSGDLEGNVTIRIDGGQIGTAAATANVHGGGYGNKTIVKGNVSVTVGKPNASESGATIYGDVYGGSALGKINGSSKTDSKTTTVTLNNGLINGSLYGGALGSEAIAADVYGPVTVTVNGGSVHQTSVDGSGAVYGCNNINGAPQNNVSVVINGTDPAPSEDSYALYAVYGGGNRANYIYATPTVTVNNCDNSIEYVYGGGNAAQVNATDVTIWGGNSIGNVFGGGNGTVRAANVTGDTNVKIYGGTIDNVFGGSNSQGTIGGTINVTVESKAAPSKSACLLHIGDLYGGGNMAASNVGNLTINCTGNDGRIDRVFGGANAANISGNIDLKINAGNIGTVFGGNNASGSISGTIAVTVGDDPKDCGIFQIENVYGGGNLAAYSHASGNYPRVSIQSGTITNSVYGGGLGESAVITGSPIVNITGGTIGYVYGGGNAAPVTGSATVNIANAQITNAVYGGGNEAGISGTTTVSITSGQVGIGSSGVRGIYGGCNSAGTVGGSATVTLTGGTVGTDGPITINSPKANVHGGGYGASTMVNGDVTVNIGAVDPSYFPKIYGDVYGGSALGNVNQNTSNYTRVNLRNGTIYGDAYGGGLGDSDNAALVNGNVTVTLSGTAFALNTVNDDNGNPVPVSGRIFGCNNINGTPKGTVYVLVTKTRSAAGTPRTKGTYELTAVYGGGNLAAYEPTNVNATGQFAELGHSATNKPVQVVINDCANTSIEYVYGGGNAACTPSTDVVVFGTYEIGSLFGGGNGKDRVYKNGSWADNPGADVGYRPNGTEYGTGESLASAYGGVIHYIFGASNTLGNIRESATAYLNGEGVDCPLHVDEVYGAGNEAYMDGSSIIELDCVEELKCLYGGAKNAMINGDIELTITSGHFDRIFGGNNLGGVINGSITVNIEETGCKPITIGELYGCGNQAAYTTPHGKSDPTINIKSFTSIGTVYGGGLGESAVVTGNPTVNINCVVGEKAGVASSHAGTTIDLGDGSNVQLPAHALNEIGALGTVFGGGNAAKVVGQTHVNVGTLEQITINSHTLDVVGAHITGNVYGGGNAADVTQGTDVIIGHE